MWDLFPKFVRRDPSDEDWDADKENEDYEKMQQKTKQAKIGMGKAFISISDTFR